MRESGEEGGRDAFRERGKAAAPESVEKEERNPLFVVVLNHFFNGEVKKARPCSERKSSTSKFPRSPATLRASTTPDERGARGTRSWRTLLPREAFGILASSPPLSPTASHGNFPCCSVGFLLSSVSVSFTFSFSFSPLSVQYVLLSIFPAFWFLTYY